MRWFDTLRLRLRSLFRRHRVERDLDTELRFHLEQQIAEQVEAGLSLPDATMAARRAFGSVSHVRDECRDALGLRLLDSLTQDVRAMRRLVGKAPTFSLTVTAMLSIGIGVTGAIFGLVNAILIRPLPYEDAGRLVAIHHLAPGINLPLNGLSTGTFLHYRDGNRVFEDMGMYFEGLQTITAPGEPEQVPVAMVSPSLFTVLKARPFLGRFPLMSDADIDSGGLMHSDAALISYDLWTRRFSRDPAILGRTITIRTPVTIVGVAAPRFDFPHHDIQVWLAFPPDLRNNRNRASVLGLAESGIARLKPGVSLDDAGKDLQRLIRSLPAAYADVTTAQIESMQLSPEITPLKDQTIGDVRLPLLLLAITGGFLLLMTWANATNLSLIRAGQLRREVALARALGATTRHVVHRFFVEGLVLATLAGLIGTALAAVAMAWHFGFDPDQIPRLREVVFTASVGGLIAGLSLVSGLLIGAASFISATRADLTGALAGALGRMTAHPREQIVRRMLVVLQVALAVPLLVGAALMAQSFWHVAHVQLGFQPERAVTFALPVTVGSAPVSGDYYHDVARLHADVLARLRALPGVEAAEASTIVPLSPMAAYRNLRIAAADGGHAPMQAWVYTMLSYATPGYFHAMGIPIVRGRTFQTGDMSRDAPGVMVSVALGRTLFGANDPVGQRIRWADGTEFPPYTVVGVVGDIAADTVQDGPASVLYVPNVYPPAADKVTGVISIYIPDWQTYIVKTSLPFSSLAPSIRRIVHEVDPNLPVTRWGTMEQRVADAMARTRLTMLLLLVGAGTALFLGMVGVYGVLAFAVRQRTSEFGVRIALGASPDRIVGMVVRQGAALVGAGLVGGLLVAWTLTRFLRGMLYEVSPNDPWAFGGMAAVLLAVALTASYIPARRAGRIDPVRALKAE